MNCYVEPVYTLDADLVLISSKWPRLAEVLRAEGFDVQVHTHSINAVSPESQLRIQFTTDERYQLFVARAIEADVLGVRTKVACLDDVVQGKLWAWSDPDRRLSKRKKDELDLVRLAEAYPYLADIYPAELRDQLRR